MTKEKPNPKTGRAPQLHQGADHSAPYPVSRLAPPSDLVDIAREIAQADNKINGRVSAKLEVIADQVKFLQAQARQILQQAQHDQRLNHAKCAFKRLPGHFYHLYERADGGLEFSMLSPRDWGGSPPLRFVASYRLEVDMSWTPIEQINDQQDPQDAVTRLLGEPADTYLNHETR